MPTVMHCSAAACHLHWSCDLQFWRSAAARNSQLKMGESASRAAQYQTWKKHLVRAVGGLLLWQRPQVLFQTQTLSGSVPFVSPHTPHLAQQHYCYTRILFDKWEKYRTDFWVFLTWNLRGTNQSKARPRRAEVTITCTENICAIRGHHPTQKPQSDAQDQHAAKSPSFCTTFSCTACP